MCVLYVSFWSKGRSRTFGCVAMDSAVLFISRSRLFCFVQAKSVCRYGCMDFLAVPVLV